MIVIHTIIESTRRQACAKQRDWNVHVQIKLKQNTIRLDSFSVRVIHIIIEKEVTIKVQGNKHMQNKGVGMYKFKPNLNKALQLDSDYFQVIVIHTIIERKITLKRQGNIEREITLKGKGNKHTQKQRNWNAEIQGL